MVVVAMERDGCSVEHSVGDVVCDDVAKIYVIMRREGVVCSSDDGRTRVGVMMKHWWWRCWREAGRASNAAGREVVERVVEYAGGGYETAWWGGMVGR
ncbi:hypothetical protein E2C01_101425 [Portunus trituberculatus]|uniref:Uncharacterized protein n=1 Tax=Portunus trituberculatus TaxID=210409 RepID=A0A5B7KG28_PORTR|nr:hypothetical protein [Portunus trituberculatus]